MNTYIFSLRRGSFSQQKIIRTPSLRSAVREIEPETADGWWVVSVSENGTPLSQGRMHVNYVLYRPAAPPVPGRDPLPLQLPEYRQIAVVETPWKEYELRIFEGNVTQVEPQFAAAQSQPPNISRFETLQEATREARVECAEAVLDGWELYRGSY
jgi:hypothetical protein